MQPNMTGLLKCAHLKQFVRAYSAGRKKHIMSLIGNREQVTFGNNGDPGYSDTIVIPFPAIRYKEPTPEIMALRGKERGDWRLLTIDEKKMLYRSSFCRTFAEFTMKTGKWKSETGFIIFYIALGIWYYIFIKIFIYNPLPDSFKDDHVKAQMRRMIDMHNNPICGFASRWDYEKKEWKKDFMKNGFFPPPNPFRDECNEIVENDYTN